MEKEQIELLLISAGLVKKEALIYLYLLEHGPSKALAIFRDLRMKKGNTYALINNLIKKGFVLKKGTLFVSQPPLNILERLEEKAKGVSAALTSLKSALPELTSTYKLTVGKPTIRYFEGQEGLIEVFNDIYAPKKEPVYGAVDIEQVESTFPNMPEAKLIPSRLKSKLEVKVVFNNTPLAKMLHDLDKKQYRESILIDKEKYPLPADIETYEDKVALMSFKRGDFIGLIIQNEDFAITLRSIFKYLFDHLRSCRYGKPPGDRR